LCAAFRETGLRKGRADVLDRESPVEITEDCKRPTSGHMGSGGVLILALGIVRWIHGIHSFGIDGSGGLRRIRARRSITGAHHQRGVAARQAGQASRHGRTICIISSRTYGVRNYGQFSRTARRPFSRKPDWRRPFRGGAGQVISASLGRRECAPHADFPGEVVNPTDPRSERRAVTFFVTPERRFVSPHHRSCAGAASCLRRKSFEGNTPRRRSWPETFWGF
jgi:hypothetical protein